MTDLGESKAVPERVWIAAYTSGPNSGVLCRGVYFRSIHNSREEADRYISYQTNPVGFTVTEYVLESTVRELREILVVLASDNMDMYDPATVARVKNVLDATK